MKSRYLLLVLPILFSTVGYANCGAIPASPALLERAQLTHQELEALEPQMDEFFEQTTEYRKCIDELMSTLVPEGVDESYFETAEYQANFQTFSNLADQAENHMNTVIERYNYLINIAAE